MRPKHPLFIHISYTMSYIGCRIRCRMLYVARTMSYTISYVRTYDIVRTTYDIVKKTYDVVRFYPFLASRTCDVVYDVVYDIVCFWTTSYVQHTISPKNVRCRTFLPVSCHFDVRHRIRYRTFFDDVAYDVPDNIGIIRSRTSGSDVVGRHRQKHTI